jgi:nitrate reductase NapE component
MTSPDQGHDDNERVPPRVQRRLRMVRFLWVSVAVVGALAVAALVIPPGEMRDAVATTAIVALVAAPVVRVAWLGIRWLRLGDPRFALVAGGLLLVVAFAALIA